MLKSRKTMMQIILDYYTPILLNNQQATAKKEQHSMEFACKLLRQMGENRLFCENFIGTIFGY